ncbi:unnamed protein product [Paramecium primaurelia]|uniref:Uncharacterized protein n=1 Tax=Paramecium primaurelia TaxID=5886 RepID=A0A8S1KJJ9_PARPR|nr:unnamed protein product [Paramecium primaurelia]
MQKYSISQSLNLAFQKQYRSLFHKDENLLFLTDSNLMQDLSHPLSIIKTQNLSSLVLDAIRELEDNTYRLFRELFQKQSIKTFNVFHQNSQNSKLCQKILQLSQNIPYYQLQQNVCDILKILEDIYKLQLNQQITNAIIFQCFQNQFYNEVFQATLFYSLYSKQILNREQKCLFLNFSGLDTIEQDFTIFKELNLLKKNNMDMYYLSFHKQELQAKLKIKNNSSQFFEQYFLEIQQDHPITWFQLKSFLKPNLKRKIQLFNPQICVLQLLVSLDKLEDKESLKLDNDCILKIVHFFQKISKDKLIINLLIKNEESNAKELIEQQQKDNFLKAKKVYLKQIINAIEQGIFGKIKVELVDKRSYDQILIDFKCQINQFKNQKYQEEIQRSFNNLIFQQAIQIKYSSELEDQAYNYIPFIDNNRSLLFFEFYFNQNKININNSTQVFFKEKEQIAIIFQVQQFKLYYCKIDCKCVKKDCKLLNLQHYQNFDNIKNDEFMKAPIIAVIEDNIYLNYGYLGDQIWEYNIINQSVIFKKRKGLQNVKYLQDAGQQQNYILEREGASVFYNLIENKDNNHYFIAGGELGQNSPICNIIEKVLPENEGFSSGFVVKSLFNINLKPFKHSLVLEGNQSVIFLPGDYNKKRYKYSQVINYQHYQYAQRLSVIRNDWLIENINIVYENEEIGRVYPIHLMPNNQQIVYNVEKDHWIVCFFGQQLQSVGSTNLYSQQIYKDEINQNEFNYEKCNKINEGNLYQVIIKMEIKYYQDQLHISIIPFQLGKNGSIIKNTVNFKTD